MPDVVVEVELVSIAEDEAEPEEGPVAEEIQFPDQDWLQGKSTFHYLMAVTGYVEEVS